MMMRRIRLTIIVDDDSNKEVKLIISLLSKMMSTTKYARIDIPCDDDSDDIVWTPEGQHSTTSQSSSSFRVHRVTTV